MRKILADVCVELAYGGKVRHSAGERRAQITLQSEALVETVRLPLSEKSEDSDGHCEFWFRDLALRQDVKLWDEEEGNLYEMTATLDDPTEHGDGQPDTIRVRFGIRTFGDNGSGRLALNGRTIFLRSEANCAEYPETGHAPMTVPEWRELLLRYRSYGCNCVRFHSHCEPEAAFAAADELGMLLQPELSHWNPKDAFATEESFRYYHAELTAILKTYVNHPSFVMLTLGNELQAQGQGRERMQELVRVAKKLDPTRLYANGPNAFYGEEGCDPESDFYTSQSCRDVVIRGTFSGMRGYLNETYPSADHTYDEAMTVIRNSYQKPVFSFEVGQFEVLPDFDELDNFHGISDPVNLKLIREKVEKQGLLPVWKNYVAATGELSRLAYREEIEAAMRTRELSGISLLGLQDFPGQGTALVGMMNSHMEPKPYPFARPERFREFFRESRIFVKLPRYTYEEGEYLTAEVEVANFGKNTIEGKLSWTLRYRNCAVNTGSGEIRSSQSGEKYSCPPGAYTSLGKLEMPLDITGEPKALLLTVSVGSCESTYPVWVYPRISPVCPANVYETGTFDERAKEVLRNGGRVYLSPEATKENLPHSIRTQLLRTSGRWGHSRSRKAVWDSGSIPNIPSSANSPRISIRTGNGGSWRQSVQ